MAAMLIAFVWSGLSSFAALTNHVSIKESMFIPDRLVIYPGDTVVWTQDDNNTEHTVTSQDSYLNSGALELGDEFSFTFDHLGTFPYYCVFHGAGAMSGTIIVAEPTDNESPHAPTNVFPADGATNQPLAVQLASGAFFDPDPDDFHAASQWIIRYAQNDAIAVDSGVVRGNQLTNFSPAGLIEGTTYKWQVRYCDGRRGWSEYSSPTKFTTMVLFNEPGIGLRGSFYNDTNFTAPTLILTNTTIDFDWGKTRPHRRITADEFAVRWEGMLLPRFSELYQIEFEFRGRARVWINEELVIDDWTPNPFILARRANVPLTAGQLIPLRIDYIPHPGAGAATLRWMSPSLPPEIVPMLRLFPPQP